MKDPSQAPDMGDLGFDLSKMPAGMDLFALLGQMPDAQRLQMADRSTNSLRH